MFATCMYVHVASCKGMSIYCTFLKGRVRGLRARASMTSIIHILYTYIHIHTFNSHVCHCHRWLGIGHVTLVESSQSPSHSQGVGVGSSLSIISKVKHSHFVCHGSGRVSGPSDSGSRSTSGDTGEGELRAGSIEVRVHSQCHTTWYGDISCKIFILHIQCSRLVTNQCNCNNNVSLPPVAYIPA